MFSYNGKIAEKQLRRMLVLPVFASCIFVLPYLSARLFGKQVVVGLFLFLVLSALYLFGVFRLGDLNVTKDQGIPGKVLVFIQLFRQMLRLGFYIVLAIAILGEAQVPFMQESDGKSNLLVVLPLLLVAVYGASHRMEKMGRLHEMIFWVMFVPFIIVVLFGLGEVDYSIFIPQFPKRMEELSLASDVGAVLGSVGWERLFLYAYSLLTFIVPAQNYIYLRPHLSGNQRKPSYWATFFVILLSSVISLFLLGIYGVYGGGNDEMITIASMRYIRLPFGVLERFDVLMVWFFMTGCFLLICNSLYYACDLVCILCNRKQEVHLDGKEPMKKECRKDTRFRVLVLMILLAVALCLVLLLPDYSETLVLFLCYGAVLDIPLSLLVPLVGRLLSDEWEEETGENI